MALEEEEEGYDCESGSIDNKVIVAGLVKAQKGRVTLDPSSKGVTDLILFSARHHHHYQYHYKGVRVIHYSGFLKE